MMTWYPRRRRSRGLKATRVPAISMAGNGVERVRGTEQDEQSIKGAYVFVPKDRENRPSSRTSRDQINRMECCALPSASKAKRPSD
jgi:hypothetical protein